MTEPNAINNPLKQLWLLLRDKFTGWWLLEVCDCPEAALVFAEKVGKELGCEFKR